MLNPSTGDSASATKASAASHPQHCRNESNTTNQMDWFNLLGVVTNPSGLQNLDGQYGVASASSPASSSHNNAYRTSRHGGLSSHGTPISLDHVGSDGTTSSSGAMAAIADDSAVGSVLAAAGMSAASATVALNSVASQLDEFTGWFDHYSRKYLGTIDSNHPVLGEYIDNVHNDADGDAGGVVGGGMAGPASVLNSYLNASNMRFTSNGTNGQVHPSMIVEYEPDLDEELTSQLEELPVELTALDLSSVEGYLKTSGMLGMRFEDRGGGFKAMRERLTEMKKDRSVSRDEGGKEKKNDTTAVFPSPPSSVNDDITNYSTISMPDIEATVPEIFFSPYFDLTNPVTFENLLVISDDEVAQLRSKEAKLHALADQKVKEAEAVAKMDAENENVVARVPPKKKEGEGLIVEGDGEEDAETAAIAGTSFTKDSKTSNSQSSSDNVITLRKPETFTSQLDAIELVLLDQVRSKSERFFRETNRFSELQHLVSSSVDEVRELRAELHSIRERCVTKVEVVPVMDDQRKDLRKISRVLEAVENVVNCKASIASLIGTGDHLGAVEAIRLARDLLAESPPNHGVDYQEDDNNEGDNEGSSTQQQQNGQQHQHHHLSLGKLKSLSKVSEQLNEYEKLVVQNLTDELVETFLSWGTSNTPDGKSGSNQTMLSFDRRAKIRGVVQSLRVCGKLGGAGLAYRKKLCELISVTVRAIVTECVADAAPTVHGSGDGSGNNGKNPLAKGTMAGVASMSLDQFFDCINMLFEQVIGLLSGAFAVNKFCIDEGFILDDAGMQEKSGAASPANGQLKSQHTPSATAAALAAAADLSEKSVSELLRLRREAHSLVSFDGMRQLWDTSLRFTHQLEKFSGRKAYGLRSTLLAQAKSFIERKHEANMSALVAALDSERWVQCNVSAERQAALTRLSSGRAAFSSRKNASGTEPNAMTSPGPNTTAAAVREKMTDAEVEGIRYKVVWSCLLLLEMVMDDVACAAHFQTLATNVVAKVAELLRLFNSRSTHLVLGAGAIHSAARLKSINAKHLAIVTQCIALVLTILPHVRAALMAQLPTKQHALLYDLDKIKADYKEHSEKILSKLVSIIGGIVEHSLAPRIAHTNFDERAENATESGPDKEIECCPFLENVMTNTRKMHQVLLVMLPAELLRDVFSRIFAYLDHKVPSLFKASAMTPKVAPNNTNATSSKQQQKPLFSMPTTEGGKLQMIREVEYMATTLNSLAGVQPWNFTAMKILEQELDIVREFQPLPAEGGEEPSGAAEADRSNIENTTEEAGVEEASNICPEASSESAESITKEGIFLSEAQNASPSKESESVAPLPDKTGEVSTDKNSPVTEDTNKANGQGNDLPPTPANEVEDTFG